MIRECPNCGNNRIALCPFCEHDYTDRDQLNAELTRLRAELEVERKRLADERASEASAWETVRNLRAELAEARRRCGVEGEDLERLRATNENLMAYIAQLQRAVKWALGEGDDFPTRQDGQGAYWWRSELRRRAALAELERP